MIDLDERVRELVASGDRKAAATTTIQALGAELVGFLLGVIGDTSDADEVFSATVTRLWRSLDTFEWRCSLRTWAYVIARREIARFREGSRRFRAGRVPISELEDVIAAASTQARRTRSTERKEGLLRLRDELAPDDRAILVLRIDRDLAWDDIALAFVPDPAACSEEERKREAARLRKRFQMIKTRLMTRAREEGLV